jgi:cytochrome c553
VTEPRDLFAAPDWHPEDHSPMPSIVANGRKPDVMACGVCHRADGAGGPENSSLFGLPASYIEQQVIDLRNGVRNGSVPRIANDLMIKTAKAIREDELRAAAAYFASNTPRANIIVVESDAVPKTQVRDLFLAPIEVSSDKEAIGQRIIEVPESVENFVSRDSRTRFFAYVAPGSIENGRHLAASGDLAVQCTACHGSDLRGNDGVPKIAGRSPTYLFRQLYDFKSGSRNGPNSNTMKPAVEKLTITDMISLAAYSASLAP